MSHNVSLLQPFALDKVKLHWSVFLGRFNANRNYVMSLKNENLLQNYELEAGLRGGMFRCTSCGATDMGDGWHWGWESPTNQLRGHFPGHWLSAAARIYAITGEPEVKLRVDRFVEGLGRCQQKNGGDWAGPIPEKYFHWTAKGQPTWALHYLVHKMFMGLIDAHVHAGSGQALDIAVHWARWFHRWSGQATYADYIERNLYNGILAQQHPGTGMNTYWLGLQPGAQKRWGHPTNDFWCCYGTLVQAHTLYPALTYYHTDRELTVSQYIPAVTTWDRPKGKATVSMGFQPESGKYHDKAAWGRATRRPNRWLVEFTVHCEKPCDFGLKFRLPWWLAGKARLTINGSDQKIPSKPSGFISVRRRWTDDKVVLDLPKGVWTEPIPDEPDTVAFMDGPCVLAGLVEEQRTLRGDKDDPASLLAPDNEREWGSWLSAYRTVGQDRNFRLLPIHEVIDQKYTVYFPLRKEK